MFSCHSNRRKNILVGLTRNNRGNDQGTRRTLLCPFWATIWSLFLGIFCLIFPFLFLFLSFLFISPSYEMPVARYQSTFRQNARPLFSVWNPSSSPGFFLKKMGGLVWNLDLKARVDKGSSPTATNYLGPAVLVYGLNFTKVFLPGHSSRPGAPTWILP